MAYEQTTTDLAPRWAIRGAVLLVGALGLFVAAPAVRGQPLPPREALPRPALTAPQAAPQNSVAKANADEPLVETLGRRGDLTLRNSSLNEALLTISELWGINVVAGEVPGSVNGVFKDAPLREILDSILISNGYGYRAVGESLVVSDLGKLGQVNPYFESATIPVAAANVDDVVAGAALLSTPAGEVKGIPSARSIFVLDFPDRVRMIREFVRTVDAAASRAAGGAPLGAGPQQLQVAYMKTHYVAALHAIPMIQTVLSPAGRVAAMEAEDRLMVVDFAENLQMAGAVLQQIDKPRPQVNVRALIYDISLQDMEEIGLNWQSLAGGNGAASVDNGSLSMGTVTSGGGALVNSITKVPFDQTSTGGSFTFFTLNNNVNIAAVASALQTATDSRLLASPNVMVVDNDEARIESVQEIPYQQLTQTSAGGNIGTTEFRDAGITLSVRPKIAHDGTIEMLLRPEFSRLTGFTPGDNQPIIDRRTAETRVRVTNGQTFVIAGLRQRSDVGDFKGVPLLKDVRFFGHLFRARETDIRESELVVFVNPTICGFDPCLTPRDQQVADTINCRLAQIPPAEGCPTGCFGGATCCEGSAPCGCAPACDATAGNAPAEATIKSAAKSDMRSNDDILPITVDEAKDDQGTDALGYPAFTWRGPRPRLLPDLESPAPRKPDGLASEPRQGPNYDARFQSSGNGVDKPASPPAKPSDSKPAPKKSFWNKLFQ